jgi:dCTP diphosphatase
MNTTDHDTPITTLKKRMLDVCEPRGWTKSDPLNCAASLSVEAGELLELLLWRKNEDVFALLAAEPQLKEKLAEELADILLNVLLFAHTIDIDLTQAFLAKMEKNALKYPIEEGGTKRRKRWLE